MSQPSNDAAEPSASSSSDWPRTRLHCVTGKGGTGKSTVAASMALALAGGGNRVLLVEVEGRQGIAQLFDTAPLPYEETHIAVAPNGGDVFALAIDPEAALLEYLEMFYNIKRGGRALRKLGAIDFATTIAPGLRDVLLTGKIAECVQRTDSRGRRIYDAVVVDSPPTGRITRFLNVTDEVSGLAKVGPVRNHADTVMNVIRSSQTAVHVVTILEEMPIQETIDGVQELREAALPLGAVIVNLMREPRLNESGIDAAARGTLDVSLIRDGLAHAHLPHRVDVDATATALATEATEHAERVLLEREQRQRLSAVGTPVYELPSMNGGVDLGALYALARLLREQGVSKP